MQTNVAAHHDHDHHHDTNGNKLFGFWVYLMSDCVLFATLFATYAVLSSNSIGATRFNRGFHVTGHAHRESIDVWVAFLQLRLQLRETLKGRQLRGMVINIRWN